jgi:alpha-D-xyloside xylohydrolase
MAGIPYWTTTDVGGFNRPDDQYESKAYHELLTRWFEYGVFCPLFRIHGNDSRTEIWNYGNEVESNFRKYDELRYRLFPYIYSTGWSITHDGYNLMRSLPLDYGDDPKVKNIGDEFMFGPSILVSPVTTASAHNRLIHLPKEPEWIDFWTGKSEAGGQTITADAPLEKIPLYVKAGSIIPMGPAMQYASAEQGSIELRVYPGQDGSFVLYDDEGDNYNYESGAYSEIPIRWKESSGTLTIGPRVGTFPGMPSSLVFRIVLIGPSHGTGIGADARPNAEISFRGPKVSVQLGKNRHVTF